MRLDHLLSRVSGQDPTTDLDPKFALRGEGQRLIILLVSYHFSVVEAY